MSYENALRKAKVAIPNFLLWLFPYLTFYDRCPLEEDLTLLSLNYDKSTLSDDPFHLHKKTMCL